MLKRNLILSLLLSFPIFANAYDAEVGGIYYNLNSEKKEAEVTFKKDYVYNHYQGNIIIPSKITFEGVEYIVTSIGYNAFESCDDLTSVTIPNTVINIRNDAFLWCSKLNSVNIPGSVRSIGREAFKATAIVNNSPDGVVYLDKWAIWHKGPIQSSVITFKEGTVGIAGQIFGRDRGRDADNLTSVIIPNSVKFIGAGVFAQFYNLDNPTLSNSLEIIEEDAFTHCINLTSVTIPNSVKLIENGVFYSCI